MQNKLKLVILDRDGVINQNVRGYIKSAHEWIPLPGSLEAIAKFYKQGIRFAVATNQSGIARKYYKLTDLHQMHQKMNNLLENLGAKFEYIAFCQHHPDENCNCRKPNPGMLEQIYEHTKIKPKNSIMIGDRIKDLQAGLTMGADAALVLTGQGQQAIIENPQLKTNGTKIYPDLAACLEGLFKN